MALANKHVKWNPLPDNDGDRHKRYKNRLTLNSGLYCHEEERITGKFRENRRDRLFRTRNAPEKGAGAIIELLEDLYVTCRYIPCVVRDGIREDIKNLSTVSNI